MEIRIQAAGASDVGQTRRTNEDAFGFDFERSLFVVCDGVGGANAGEIASRSAVERAIQSASQSIFHASERDPLYRGMATTIVAAHFDGARMWVGHVGDSRAYLLRGQSLHRLTDDHSQLAHLLRLGDVRGANQAEIARLDSVLTQALGASERVVPAVTRVQVERGDCFLLATDGITKALTQADMLALMLSSTSPDQACQKLITAANRAGGEDNATCILVEID
jgi:serine/threonine protein phosphatase PrpC